MIPYWNTQLSVECHKHKDKLQNMWLNYGFRKKQSIYDEHFNDLHGKRIYCLEKTRKNSYDFSPFWDDLSLFNKTAFFKTSNLAYKC